MNWLASFAIFWATLLLLDWVYADRIWMFGIGAFKIDPSATEKFFVLYRAGRPRRIIIATLLSLVGTTIMQAGFRAEIQVLVAVIVIVIYSLTLGFAVWQAKRQAGI